MCSKKKEEAKQRRESTSCASQEELFWRFFPTKLKNLASLFRTPERRWRFQWNQQCHDLHEYASPPPRQRCRKLQCQKSTVGGERPLALSDGRLSLTTREKQAFECQMCILHKRRNFPHEDHGADRGFHSWHHHNLIHTLVPISKATKNPSVKIDCKGRKIGRVLFCKKIEKRVQLGKS